jgi:hypothetical protein
VRPAQFAIESAIWPRHPPLRTGLALIAGTSSRLKKVNDLRVEHGKSVLKLSIVLGEGRSHGGHRSAQDFLDIAVTYQHGHRNELVQSRQLACAVVDGFFELAE